MTAPGWVKSTTTSHPVRASSGSPRSTSALTCISGASATAAHTVRPIRPRAPSTPTFITAPAYSAATWPLGQRGGEGVGVVERAHHGQGLRLGEDLPGHRADVVVGDRVYRGEDLLDRFQTR